MTRILRLKDKRIALVDMDQILANLAKKWLGSYNIDHDDKLTIDDIKTWEVGHHTKIGKDAMEQLYLLKPGFFDDLEPLEGGLDALRQLHDFGLHVQILSSPFGSDSARAKIEWILRHLPWMDRKNIALAHYKQLFFGHYFVDDSVRNLMEWKDRWSHELGRDHGHALSIEYPWHQAGDLPPEIKAFPNYNDTGQAWHLMVEHIKETLA